MNKNTLSLFNKFKADALMRTSDNPEILAYYAERYFNQSLTIDEATPVFRAIQTANAKRKKPATQPELVETI